MADTTPRRDGPGSRSTKQITSSPEFRHLVSRRWSVSLVLLAALFVTYYGYILLIAYAPELMRRKAGEATTVAIPVAVGVILVAFALTAIYVAWANGSFDPAVDRLKRQIRR